MSSCRFSRAIEHSEVNNRTLQKAKSAAPAKDKSSPGWREGQPPAERVSHPPVCVNCFCERFRFGNKEESRPESAGV